jgi:branched-chain amino acid transport system substrate-binding protein
MIVRDAIEQIENFPSAGGIFTMSSVNHGGIKPESIVLMKIVDKKWTLLQ